MQVPRTAPRAARREGMRSNELFDGASFSDFALYSQQFNGLSVFQTAKEVLCNSTYELR